MLRLLSESKKRVTAIMSKRQNTTQRETLYFSRLSNKAMIPVKGTPGAAGYDLFASENVEIQPWSRAVVQTDIQIYLPVGCYGRIAPRSGLAAEYGLLIGGGVCDRDYSGKLKIICFNMGDEKFTVRQGYRIAQLILERIYEPDIEEIHCVKDGPDGPAGPTASKVLNTENEMNGPCDTQGDNPGKDEDDQSGAIKKGPRGTQGFGSTGLESL